MNPGSVLLVGATRGLGLALAALYLAKGWRVTATTIAPSAELDALAERYGGTLSIHLLDITDAAGVECLRQAFAGEPFDVLHIVAGILPEENGEIWENEDDFVLQVLKTNAFGAVRLARRLEEQVRDGGAFVFTSSGMGSLTRNDRGGADLYRVSKVALNMLVRSFAATTAGPNRAVLLLCPGWAKTPMGGPEATVEVADSVEGMYRLVVETQPEASGARFLEYTGAAVPW